LTPGSCLDTAWRSHAPSPPVFVAKSVCGHPRGANLNLSLSLTRRKLCGANEQIGALLRRHLAHDCRECRSRDGEGFGCATPWLAVVLLKIESVRL